MKKWLAACLCTVMLLSLAACGASTEKTSGPYAEMTEDEWEELWNEAKTQQDSFERIFDKQKGDYEFTERERVSSIDENFMARSTKLNMIPTTIIFIRRRAQRKASGKRRQKPAMSIHRRGTASPNNTMSISCFTERLTRRTTGLSPLLLTARTGSWAGAISSICWTTQSQTG